MILVFTSMQEILQIIENKCFIPTGLTKKLTPPRSDFTGFNPQNLHTALPPIWSWKESLRINGINVRSCQKFHFEN